MYDEDHARLLKPPSVLALLRQAYKRDGALSMLGFTTTTPNQSSKAAEHSVISRSQLSKSQKERKSLKATPSATNTATSLLEHLAEHPALGGTAVFDNLPKQPKQRGAPESEIRSHRKARLWMKARTRRREMQEATATHARRWAKILTVANVFRVIPPYCFGFLVYSIMAGDLSE